MYDGIPLHEVSPGAVAVVDERFVSNVAAVILSEFIVVIDAGLSAYAARRLREALEESYRRPVRYAVLTHYHVDHVAGMPACISLMLRVAKISRSFLESVRKFSVPVCLDRKDSGITTEFMDGFLVEKGRPSPDWCDSMITNLGNRGAFCSQSIKS